MPPRALSQGEIESFRADLCRVATRLFAEEGFAGVTMRGLAAEIGCSPMTPYRYFRSKHEIFAAVRIAGLERFADVVSAAAAAERRPLAQLQAIGDAYVGFALGDPERFRVVFHVPDAVAGEDPGVLRELLRAQGCLRAAVAGAVEEGALAGEVDTLAHVFWAGMHGLVSLYLAGRLQSAPGLDRLVQEMWGGLVRGLAPQASEAGS